MAEDLNIVSGSKEEKYISITAQIKALMDGEPDLTANLANIAAALKEQFGWFWVGFYMVKPQALQPDAPKSNFEVVDTYSYENRTCSVIRYTTPSTTWVYLLDCKEVKK